MDDFNDMENLQLHILEIRIKWWRTNVVCRHYVIHSQKERSSSTARHYLLKPTYKIVRGSTDDGDRKELYGRKPIVLFDGNTNVPTARQTSRKMNQIAGT
jgi:hypothetical protein